MLHLECDSVETFNESSFHYQIIDITLSHLAQEYIFLFDSLFLHMTLWCAERSAVLHI